MARTAKQARFLALFFIFILLLSGCSSLKAAPYTAEDDWGNIWLIDPQKRTITGQDITYKYQIRGDQESYIIIIEYPDGNRYTEDKIGDVLYGDYKYKFSSNFWLHIGNFFGIDVYTKTPSLNPTNGPQLTKLLYPLIPESAIPQYWLAALAAFGLGFVDILWPRFFWFFRYGLDARYVEISKKAQLVQNLIGLAFIILGIVLLLV